MSDFVGEQSRVHIMPISTKWKSKSSIHIGFIVFNGGVTTFFAKSVYSCHKLTHIIQSCSIDNGAVVVSKSMGQFLVHAKLQQNRVA